MSLGNKGRAERPCKMTVRDFFRLVGIHHFRVLCSTEHILFGRPQEFSVEVKANSEAIEYSCDEKFNQMLVRASCK